MNFAEFSEKVRVADFREALTLLFSSQSRQIVHFFCVHARDIALRLLGQRRLGQELRPRRTSHAGDKTVVAKSFAVEKACRAEIRIEFAVVILIKTLRVYSQLAQQLLSDIAVFARAFDGLGSAIAD